MIFYYAHFIWCLFTLSVCFYECKKDKSTVREFLNCFIYCVPFIGYLIFLLVIASNSYNKIKNKVNKEPKLKTAIDKYKQFLNKQI